MIGLMPFVSKSDSGLILRKVAGALSPLAVGDGVIVLQALGNTGVSRPIVSGLTTLASNVFGYSVKSNNGSTSSNGTSSFRLSYGSSNTTAMSVTSYHTSDIISKTGGGPVSMVLARTTSGLYTPTGFKPPVSYVAVSWVAGAVSPSTVNTDNITIGTVNGIAPSVSRFYSTGALHTITAGVNSLSAVAKVKIGVWQSNFGNSPVNIVVGASGSQAVFAVYAT